MGGPAVDHWRQRSFSARSSGPSAIPRSRGRPRLRFWRQRRQPTVRGILHQRRPAVCEMTRARLPPVGAGGIVGDSLAVEDLPFVRRCFFRGEDGLLPEIARTLERRHRGVVPGALQVRVAPRRARRPPGLGGRDHHQPGQRTEQPPRGSRRRGSCHGRIIRPFRSARQPKKELTMSRRTSGSVALASLAVALLTISSSARIIGQIYVGGPPAAAGQWAAQPSTKNGEWPHYTADVRGNRYSPLDQINASNFNKLEIAWRYKTDNLGPRPEYKLEGTPLMIKGVLYTTGGTRRSVIALDAKTGETIWTHSLREGKRAAVSPRQLSGRGVSYWTDGRGDERILYVTTGYRLVALNAKTGAVIPSFGKDGIVDLKTGMVTGSGQAIDLETGEIGIHSTPIVVKDSVIIGSSMREGATVPTHNNTKGLVRAFDVRTGKRLWQ